MRGPKRVAGKAGRGSWRMKWAGVGQAAEGGPPVQRTRI